MHQVKIFIGIENDVATLESEVNQWLVETGVKVVNVFGNIAPQSTGPDNQPGLTRSAFSPSDIMLVVVYEKQN